MVVITSENPKNVKDDKIYIIEVCAPEKKTGSRNINKWLHILVLITTSILAAMILLAVINNVYNVKMFVEKGLLQEESREKPMHTLEPLLSFEITSYSKAYLFPSAKSFHNATVYCDDLGMKLFKINSTFKQNLIFNHTEKMFSSGGGTRIWVNGQWSADDQQWLSYPDNEEVFPSTPSNSFYQNTDDKVCLAIQSFIENVYEIASVRCSATNYFYCES